MIPLLAETPEEVATSYFEKIKSGGLNTVAELMHPDELRKFLDMMTPIVQEGLASEREKRTFRTFEDPKNGGKMRNLDDSQFMNVSMEWLESLQPGLTAMLKNATVEALGHVRENDINHVVLRMKMKNEGVEAEKLSVVSVKDYRGVPKMILTGEMKGIAESLRRKR